MEAEEKKRLINKSEQHRCQLTLYEIHNGKCRGNTKQFLESVQIDFIMAEGYDCQCLNSRGRR